VTAQHAADPVTTPDVDPDVGVVRLPSEVDLQTAPAVRDELMASLNRCAHLVVDATGVQFMDSSGVNALVRAKERADQLDGTVHVVATGRAVVRVLALTQLTGVLGVVPDPEAARRCVDGLEPGHTCQEQAEEAR
jgi:anti-anti-sigma factor